MILRHAGKVTAWALPMVLAAELGLPALGALLFLAVIALGVICWIIGSDARSERVTRMILAGKGEPGCLTSAFRPYPPMRRK